MDQLHLHFPNKWQEQEKVSLFKALYLQLKNLIHQAVLKPSDQLPPSRSLAENLGISRNTVNRAYELLIDDGYILNKPGSGFFVNEQVDFSWSHLDKQKSQSKHLRPIGSKVAQDLIKQSKNRGNIRNTMVFGLGKPPLDLFPNDVWARVLSRRWRLSAQKLGSEIDPMGYKPLRKSILDHLIKTRGIHCELDQIMITSGSQQAIDLCSRVLFDPGSRIALSDPCYDGLYQLFKSHGHEVVLCRHDLEGMKLDPLKMSDQKTHAILTTPSRQYPLGIVMSLQRRLEILEYAKTHNLWIIEDDYDGELRFDGPPVPAMQGLDQGDQVIYTGTFSRTMFSGLRIGFLVIPTDLIPAFRAVRKIMDGHTSILPQAAMADFIEEGYYLRHVKKLNKALKQRRNFLRTHLNQMQTDAFELLTNDGGLQLCVRLDPKIVDLEFANRCHEKGVGVTPLSPFYKGDHKRNGLVFNFASFDEKVMEIGLEKINRLLMQ